ncbi:MAG: hypothetical protein U0132_18795 [Gemmatimonadaceae bacterium]
MKSAETKERSRKTPRADAPLGIRERLRNQWDVLDLQRRLLENADQRVRYGLVIFGAVNTGVVVLLTKAPAFSELSPTAVMVLRAVAIVYVIVAFTVLGDSLRSLRPALSPKTLVHMLAGFTGPPRRDQVLLTLMPTEKNQLRLADLHRAWCGVTGEQLSAELSQASVICSSMMDTKLVAVRRLYAALAVMLLLAAGSLAALTVIHLQ